MIVEVRVKVTEHKYKRNEKLYQVALRSDWRYSARLAVIGGLIGIWLVPAMLANNPTTQALGKTIQVCGWVFAIGFGAIAAYRFVKQRQEKRGT